MEKYDIDDEFDPSYMRRAIELARRGTGAVNPNPLVGAVIVKDGRIIGEGYHVRYGAVSYTHLEVYKRQTQKSYEEKYESLEILSKALNVLFEGYSLYEVSNKIEDQYIELTWCCNFLNANPCLLYTSRCV